MERTEIIWIILRELEHIYGLNESQKAETLREISQYNEKRLAQVLQTLSDYRGKQAQTIDRFLSQSIRNNHSQIEKSEREKVKPPIIF